jgi:hypothetical protein
MSNFPCDPAPSTVPDPVKLYPHYYKDVRHLRHIDVYRVLKLWEVTDPSIAHAIKKLLAAGQRGAKDDAKDVKEAIDSLQRWQAMRVEDGLSIAKIPPAS